MTQCLVETCAVDLTSLSTDLTNYYYCCSCGNSVKWVINCILVHLFNAWH